MNDLSDSPRVVAFPLRKAKPQDTPATGCFSFSGAHRRQQVERAQKNRVQSIAELATELMRWKERAITEVDRDFALQQLEAAIRSLK